ncbi:UNVERIFIED_CONTAM: hypothetical protein PYX00_003573 [Menopon gallinae]|uniref:Porimin n=1 Tax=Menopon gallinae TaxID=328185 RepID=A0AAW2I259_9NEOP
MQSMFVTVLICFTGVSLIYGSPIDSQNATEISKEAPTLPVTVPPHTTLEDHAAEKKPEKVGNGTLPVNGTAAKNSTGVIDKKVIQVTNDTTTPSTVVTTTKQTPETSTVTSTNATSRTEGPEEKKTNASTTAAATTGTSPSTTKTTPTSTTTEHPTFEIVTEEVEAKPDRQFDGPSFIGGIILALGLTGIGFVAYKFCKGRTDRTYRNL